MFVNPSSKIKAFKGSILKCKYISLILLTICVLLSLLLGLSILRPWNTELQYANNNLPAGFPKNIREAAECFFGNYNSIVENLESNILLNKNRIRIIHRGNEFKTLQALVVDKQKEKTSVVLANTNVGLALQLNQLRDKCSSFPRWD